MSNIADKDKQALDDALEKLLRAAGMKEHSLDFSFSAALDQTGVTTIDDGGTLSGTYNGTVMIVGSATMTGDVVINGALYVTEDLTNGGGFALTTLSDVWVDGCVRFTPDAIDSLQSDISIGGDFHARRFCMNVNQGVNPTLKVSGDIIGLDESFNTEFHCYGKDGASGLRILVLGDIIVDYVDLTGGDATDSLPAGHGGYLGVGGDATFYDGLDIGGGGTEFDGLSAGDGGYIECEGTFTGYVYCAGGNAYARSNAGDGGNLYSGTFINFWSNLGGGDCDATQADFTAGWGGQVYVWGDGVYGDSYLSLNAGNRSGEFNAAPQSGNQCPSGGSLFSAGDILLSHVEAYGGSDGSSYQKAQVEELTIGAGGLFLQADYFVVTDTNAVTWAFWYNIEGDDTEPTGDGYVNSTNKIAIAINAGMANTDVADQTFSGMNGSLDAVGVARHDVAGITVTQSAVGIVAPIVFHNADDTAPPSGLNSVVTAVGDLISNASGGQGGQVEAKGDVTLYALYLSGGNSQYARDGGLGGSVTTKGRLHCSYRVDISGGDGEGVNGGPGYITAKSGLLAQNVIAIDGTGSGTGPSNYCGVLASGSVTIGELNVASRSNAVIGVYGNQVPAVWAISHMSTKVTLTQPGGEDTVDVSSMCGINLFLFDANNGWLNIPGSSLGEG